MFCQRQGIVYLLFSSEKHQPFYGIIIFARLNPTLNIRASHFPVLFAKIILSAKRRLNLSQNYFTSLRLKTIYFVLWTLYLRLRTGRMINRITNVLFYTRKLNYLNPNRILILCSFSLQITFHQMWAFICIFKHICYFIFRLGIMNAS